MLSTPSPPVPSSSRSSPSSYGLLSDDSIDPELSFEYELDSEGNAKRVAKGSSKSPQSRPTSPPSDETSKKSTVTASAVAALGSAVRRLSLSRSGSFPEEELRASQPRTLQRVHSGTLNNLAATAVTPAPTVRSIAPFSGGLRGTGRKLGGALRIRREDAERQRREAEEEAEREAQREMLRRAQEEKENNIDGRPEERRSPPLASARQIAALPVSTLY
jgi:hypothetical protein